MYYLVETIVIIMLIQQFIDKSTSDYPGYVKKLTNLHI